MKHNASKQTTAQAIPSSGTRTYAEAILGRTRAPVLLADATSDSDKIPAFIPAEKHCAYSLLAGKQNAATPALVKHVSAPYQQQIIVLHFIPTVKDCTVPLFLPQKDLEGNQFIVQHALTAPGSHKIGYG